MKKRRQKRVKLSDFGYKDCITMPIFFSKFGKLKLRNQFSDKI